MIDPLACLRIEEVQSFGKADTNAIAEGHENLRIDVTGDADAICHDLDRRIDEGRFERALGHGAIGAFLSVFTASSEPLDHAFDVTLLPSLAYGPGRYDFVYEEGSVDFPIGYVRWAENRNMETFLRLVAKGKIDLEAMVPARMPLEDAPAAYDLLRSSERPPTVLLTYGQA